MFRCLNRAKKNRLLKYPCLLELTVILSIYYLWRHIASNGRRYVGIAFAFMFFMSSCSFSFAVFTRQTSFISTQEPYNAIVENSDIEFAVEKEIMPSEDIFLASEEAAKEYSDIEDIENADFYTLDDILEETDYTAAEGETVVTETESKATLEMVFDSSDWRLLLVNKQHPIPEDYSFNLGVDRKSVV